VVLRLQDADVILGTPSSNTITVTDAGLTPGVNDTTSPGEWTNGACWTQGRMPIAGDTVTVKHALTIRTNTFPMASCTITNTTLTLRNWDTALQATTIRVANNGIVTCFGPFTQADISNRVYVVCSNLTVDANGSIDVSKKGYANASGPGKGHGGCYGTQKKGYNFGVAYGSMTAPEAPGSGGLDYYSTLGGHAGGAVRVVATGTVTVNGSVLARGQDGWERGQIHASAGSGGGIYITCRRLEGASTGLIQVNGGNAGWAGWAGGGGRIAVIYNVTAQAGYCPGVRFQSSGGTHSPRRMFGPDGTIYFPDRSFVTETMNAARFGGGRVFAANFTNWAVGSLVVSNCDFTFGQESFGLTVTNNIVVSTSGELTFSAKAQIACKNLILTNGGDMLVYSGPTNASGPNYGASVTASGYAWIGPGSWVYPISDITNGGSPLFTLGQLTVKSTGGFDADGYGYGQKKGPGAGNGAGHGGIGGSGTGGTTYDTTNMPVRPGSGAYNYTVSAQGGGEGGGAIRIRSTGAVVVDGSLLANGSDGWDVHGGGGAGGTVFVDAFQFSGAGTGAIQVKGGAGNNAWGAGAGGGRVAIWVGNPPENLWPIIRAGTPIGALVYSTSWADYLGTINVTNGVGSPGNGTTGTRKFVYYLPPKGTIFQFR